MIQLLSRIKVLVYADLFESFGFLDELVQFLVIDVMSISVLEEDRKVVNISVTSTLMT